VVADVKIGDVENDVEEGEGGTGIIYDLICEPKIFRTREFDFFLIWFLFPVEKENEPVNRSVINNVEEEGGGGDFIDSKDSRSREYISWI